MVKSQLKSKICERRGSKNRHDFYCVVAGISKDFMMVILEAESSDRD